MASILFLFVLHSRLDLPVDASRRAAAAGLVAAAVAASAWWTSQVLGLPAGRPDALWSVVWLGAIGSLVYLGLVAWLRLVPVREVYRGLRDLLRRPR